MKKGSAKVTLRPEYKVSDFPDGLQRGKYASNAAASSNIVVLEPELAVAFPNSAAVNDALRIIVQAAKHVGSRP